MQGLRSFQRALCHRDRRGGSRRGFCVGLGYLVGLAHGICRSDCCHAHDPGTGHP